MVGPQIPSARLRKIGDYCGGFVGIDEDTKNRMHFFWARSCVARIKEIIPNQIELPLGDQKLEISILEDALVTISAGIGTVVA